MKSFTYCATPPADDIDTFVAIIPPSIRNPDDLFCVLFEKLNLPGYFGFNWNALSDCLRDFHWISQKRIVIYHCGLPVVGEDDLLQYLDVLDYCIQSWSPDAEHELIVAFPPDVQPQLERLIAG